MTERYELGSGLNVIRPDLKAHYETASCIHSFYSQPQYLALGAFLGNRSKWIRFLLATTNFVGKFNFGIFLLILFAFLFYSKLRRPRSAGCIFQFGMSMNNERMFDKLNTIMSDNTNWRVETNDQEISFLKRLQWLNIFAIWYLSARLRQYVVSEPFVLIQLALGVAATLLFEKAYREQTPAAVIVSNDHSGTCVAARCAAQALGIKVVYIQHAPVNEFFPPLKFDLSILHDQASVDNYRKSALNSGAYFDEESIVILSPFADNFVSPKMSASKKLRIGVLLGLITNYDVLNALLSKLSQHSNVSVVGIREHPRGKKNNKPLPKADKINLTSTNDSLKKFLENYGDIVLVDNSGATIESLHLGCPTFQVLGIDYTIDTGYSFHSESILPTFTPDILDFPQKVSSLFSGSWIETFSKYDATCTSSIRKMEATVRFSLEKILADVTSDN